MDRNGGAPRPLAPPAGQLQGCGQSAHPAPLRHYSLRYRRNCRPARARSGTRPTLRARSPPRLARGTSPRRARNIAGPTNTTRCLTGPQALSLKGDNGATRGVQVFACVPSDPAFVQPLICSTQISVKSRRAVAKSVSTLPSSRSSSNSAAWSWMPRRAMSIVSISVGVALRIAW